jgi:hypothetical protein
MNNYCYFYLLFLSSSLIFATQENNLFSDEHRAITQEICAQEEFIIVPLDVVAQLLTTLYQCTDELSEEQRIIIEKYYAGEAPYVESDTYTHDAYERAPRSDVDLLCIPCMGLQGPPGPQGCPGPAGSFSGIVTDTDFLIVDAADPSRHLQFLVQGSPSTTTTFITDPSVDRSLTTPDIDGTIIVEQTGTHEVFIGGPTGPLHGSNSGIQYSSTFASRAQIRENQYGNNTGVPGISTFKSRGATIGSLAPVQPGDVIYRATAVGVTDNLSIPLSGFISIIVAPNGVPIGQGWIATDYEIQLVPLAGPANGRRQIFRITSEGIFHIRETANSMAGVATTTASGSVTVPNTQITATSRITLTIQDGGTIPTGFVYVSSRIIGTSFTITSSTADIGVPVYYQIWEPTS